MPFPLMTIAVEKRDMDMDSVNVWLTSNYDYLKPFTVVNSGVFQFNVLFGGTKKTRTTIMETMIKPLKCKSSDSYVSDMQCFANLFFSQDLLPCPVKCLPIQMKGLQYLNKSISLTNCAKLEDEICNGGPKVWKKLNFEFPNCMNPCKMVTYKDSHCIIRRKDQLLQILNWS